MARRKKTNRKLLREFAFRKKSELGGDDKARLTKQVASYANLIFEMTDDLPDLTPNDLRALLWFYQFEYVTREYVVNHLRVGRSFINVKMPKLVKAGYLDIHGKSKKVPVERHISSDFGDYILSDEERTTWKYMIGKKGKKVCQEFVDRLHSNPQIMAPPIEGRAIESHF